MKKTTAKNYAGQKYNRLTFIEPTSQRAKDKSIIWKLLCDCGIFIYKSPNNILRGTQKSCGCALIDYNISKGKDYTGQKYNRWTFIEITDKFRYGKRLWKLKCDCGTIVYGTVKPIFLGESKSCGCLTEEKTSLWNSEHNPIISCARNVWNFYKDGCDFQSFLRISQENCYYCNCVPYRTRKQYKNNNISFTYNGLDRIDSSKNHSVCNVVPCCFNCNRIKSNMSYYDFIEYVSRIYNNVDRERYTKYNNTILSSMLSEPFLEDGLFRPIIISARTVWRRYRDGCGFESFLRWSQNNCYYCNSVPSNKYNLYNCIGGEFIYNGLDRVDNSKDHSIENIVPCCAKCNFSKSDMIVNEFIDLIKNIFNNTKNKKTPIEGV